MTILGVSANLILLGYFKYADFFVETTGTLLGLEVTLLNIVLPLAISFFTLQQIAYLVDCYKDEGHEYDFVNYALFVTFFPQLIAGPIVHHKEMMPQFARSDSQRINTANVLAGLFIFSVGLFKKVVIADSFAVWATTGFDAAPSLTFFEAWAASLSYTLQLYFDFSGYSDMAIGLALIFNIRLPLNFNSPYKATSIQDFWRRWHMTLSRFLKDYVYIPLGGSRNGVWRTYFCLMATFLIGGLWHGAAWTFVFWGFLHGLALVIERVWQKIGFRLPRWLAWVITFNFINVAWVFFRATSWEDAMKVLKGMFWPDSFMFPLALEGKLAALNAYGVTFGPWLQNVQGNFNLVIVLALGILAVISLKNTVELQQRLTQGWLSAVWAGVCFAGALLAIGTQSEFLYFNF